MDRNPEYDIYKALQRIENEMIESMIRNFDRHRAEEKKEGINWTAWQAEQLKALEQYKRRNLKKYQGVFGKLNSDVESLIRLMRQTGRASQEIGILEALKKGYQISKELRKATTEGRFFKTNDRKLNALIKATIQDMEKAEQAVLRMANDKYRKAIFAAQVYANTGAGTYEKAVDMATKDMLSAGLNCVEYKNGARHTLANYARMAIKTANKRAYLMGEGEKRAEWGVHTVILKKRGNACPLCLPFVGKVLIDDVYSGGTKADGNYPLLSAAMAAGLYHPNCKDIHTTYFPGISTPPEGVNKEDVEKAKEDYTNEQKQNYCKNNAERFQRMSENSLDPDNKRKYAARAKEWEEKEKFYQKSTGEDNEHLSEKVAGNELVRTFDAPTNDNTQLFRDVIIGEHSIEITRNKIVITANNIVTSKNNLYLSQKAKLKPKGLQLVDNSISEAMKKLSITDTKDFPTILVVGQSEMKPGVLAAYNAYTNVLYVNELFTNRKSILTAQEVYAASEDVISTYVHELIHWQDAMRYKRKYGNIDEKYMSWIIKDSKRKLEKTGQNSYTINRISEYASQMFKDGRFDEVYTEYRVKQLFKG